jgi:acetyl esterase/lipase
VVPVPTVDEKDDGTTMLRMTTDAAPVEQLNYDPPFEPVIGPDGSKTWSGLSFSTGIGYRPVLLDVRVPAFTNATAAGTPTPLPALMWVHGGAWWAGDRRYLPPTLAPGELADAALARGMAYVAVDYRLALEAPFPAQIHDVKAAIRYVRRFADVFGIDADRLGALGESAGGHLVALLALTAGIAAIDGTEGVPDGRSDVAAVVDWYGVHDIRAWAGEQSGDEPSPIAMLLGQASGAPTDTALAASASPVTYVSPTAAPILLIHGDADLTVPFSQSEELLAAGIAAGMDIELARVPDADHCFVGYPDVPSLVARSVDWLASRLNA